MAEQQAEITEKERCKIITYLNDQLRQYGIGGRILITSGVEGLGEEMVSRIYRAVQDFNVFNQDNDPYGEHDFGAVAGPGIPKTFFKIDYYDKNLEFCSEDPADPKKTIRVMTIMLPEEY